MRALAAAALLLSFLPAARAGGTESSIRCRGGVVAVGDPTIDLLGKCGVPRLREVVAYDTGAVLTMGPVFGRAAVGTTERWTYDFGPQQFAMTVTVEGGKVFQVERGNRGYERQEEAPPPIPRAACDSSRIQVGDSKLDLLSRCGDPALVELRKENVTAGPREAVLLSRAIPKDVEVWTYDFGPQQLVRFAVLADGVVIRVDTGAHGYSRVDPAR
jgi:hypothetical protein